MHLCQPTHLQLCNHTSQQTTGRNPQQLVFSSCLPSSMGSLNCYQVQDGGSRPLQPKWPHVLATGHQDDLRIERRQRMLHDTLTQRSRCLHLPVLHVPLYVHHVDSGYELLVQECRRSSFLRV